MTTKGIESAQLNQDLLIRNSTKMSAGWVIRQSSGHKSRDSPMKEEDNRDDSMKFNDQGEIYGIDLLDQGQQKMDTVIDENELDSNISYDNFLDRKN